MRRIRLSDVQGHQLFLKWLLINVVYLLALVTGMVMYNGKVEIPGKLAIGLVLVVYGLASLHAGWLAWKEDKSGIHHTSFAIELAPKIAMLGTVGGFLIAFSAASGDLQQRAIGASTGLAATFVGISVMVVLEIIRHVLEND